MNALGIAVTLGRFAAAHQIIRTLARTRVHAGRRSVRFGSSNRVLIGREVGRQPYCSEDDHGNRHVVTCGGRPHLSEHVVGEADSESGRASAGACHVLISGEGVTHLRCRTRHGVIHVLIRGVGHLRVGPSLRGRAASRPGDPAPPAFRADLLKAGAPPVEPRPLPHRDRVSALAGLELAAGKAFAIRGNDRSARRCGAPALPPGHGKIGKTGNIGNPAAGVRWCPAVLPVRVAPRRGDRNDFLVEPARGRAEKGEAPPCSPSGGADARL
jgi:hypothetical protein